MTPVTITVEHELLQKVLDNLWADPNTDVVTFLRFKKAINMSPNVRAITFVSEERLRLRKPPPYIRMRKTKLREYLP